jgi:hypothetical protein
VPTSWAVVAPHAYEAAVRIDHASEIGIHGRLGGQLDGRGGV